MRDVVSAGMMCAALTGMAADLFVDVGETNNITADVSYDAIVVNEILNIDSKVISPSTTSFI
ncbi:MAG: hypothetical protein R6V06_03435 [Kiritimatiellia bacterium]